MREPTLFEFWETIEEVHVFLNPNDKEIIEKMLDPQYDPKDPSLPTKFIKLDKLIEISERHMVKSMIQGTRISIY